MWWWFGAKNGRVGVERGLINLYINVGCLVDLAWAGRRGKHVGDMWLRLPEG